LATYSLETNGHIIGDLANTDAAAFSQTGFYNGTVQDLNGDGGKDVGSTNVTKSAYATDWVYATTGTGGPYTLIDANGLVKLASVTFSVKSLGDGASTVINIYPWGTTSTTASQNATQFEVAGTAYNIGSGITGATFSTTMLSGKGLNTVGLTVQPVPEPSLLILLGMGLLSLLAIRRK
jgi:hypothetical protein